MEARRRLRPAVEDKHNHWRSRRRREASTTSSKAAARNLRGRPYERRSGDVARANGVESTSELGYPRVDGVELHAIAQT